MKSKIVILLVVAALIVGVAVGGVIGYLLGLLSLLPPTEVFYHGQVLELAPLEHAFNNEEVML